MYVAPKKHLGQHFLINAQIAQDIAHALTGFGDYKTVLEIGPGTGALTRHLLPLGYDTHVVEIDQQSVVYLHLHYPELKNKIHSEDFLRMNLTAKFPQSIAVIGNFPYNISSQILFHFLDYKDHVPELVGMFQKEVALRVANGPGTKDYGILSVLIQAWYDVEYLFTVNENEFNPPPKVKSGVIRMKRKDIQHLGCDEVQFKQLVKLAFNQRRKTLRNSIKSILNGQVIDADILQKRPEQLSVAQFIELTNLVFNPR
jgi:16S rRNA (adenine1518-N6/adenine1519-N6)-dimethyltransferase